MFKENKQNIYSYKHIFRRNLWKDLEDTIKNFDNGNSTEII